jgi:hypothetical protein
LSVGNYYIDPWIVRDYTAAIQTPVVKLVYHVPRTGYDVPSQIAKLREGLDLLPSNPAAIVLDMEGEDAKFTPAQITECLWQHIDQLSKFWWGSVLLYLNLNYLNNVLGSTFGLPVWISWPGAGGIYNPNPSPPVDNWLLYQRSFTHTIPGVPDPTVDLDEFNGDNAAMLEYFGEDEPGGEDMIEQKLDTIIELLTEANNSLDMIVAYMQNEPEPTPEPDPTPTTYRTVVVGKDPKANAFFARDHNKAGKPIMAIYPSDTSATAERIQFVNGATLWAARQATVADGGGEYFLLRDFKGRTNEPLYVRLIDLL